MKANRRFPLHARDVVSLVVALLFIGPLVWLVLGSLQQPGQASPALSLFPNPVSLSNYGQVFQVYDLVRPIFNSFVVVLAAVPLTIITASCAGFAMSQLEGPLRQRLVLLTVILMIVPIPALWLPRFVMFSTVGDGGNCAGNPAGGSIVSMGSTLSVARWAFLTVKRYSKGVVKRC